MTREYDIIFCNATIHCIGDKQALFNRVYKSLCLGGWFAFTTPDGCLPIPEIRRKVSDEYLGLQLLQWMSTEVKPQYLTVDEYQDQASIAGFDKGVTIHPRWRNLDHYIDSMHGWFGEECDLS